MKIKEISIKNFRGIANGKIKDLAQINLLVGPNGCGKSTILESIYLFRKTPDKFYLNQQPESVVAYERDKNRANINETWWYKANTENDIEVEILFDRIIERARQKWGLTIRLDKAGISSNINSISRVFDPDEFKNISDRIQYFSIRFQKEIKLQEFYQDMIIRREEKSLIEMINSVYNLKIEGINIINNSIWVAFDKYSIVIDSLGSGIRMLFVILVLIYSLKPSVLLVEEFDAFQYPESLKKIMRALIRISNEKDIQMFLTTHSLETAQILLDCGLEEKLNSINFYTLALDNETGVLDVSHSGLKGAELLIKNGRDIRYI